MMMPKQQSISYNPRKSGMPFAPKYFTTLQCTLNGYIPAGTVGTVQTYAITLSQLSLPFSYNGGSSGYVAWPSPFTSLTAQDPVGLRNVLFNSATNSGLYNGYRVHAVQVDVTFQPEDFQDTMAVCITSHTGPTAYTTFNTATDSPLSKRMFATQFGARNNKLSYFIKSRQLRGQSKQQFMDDPNNTGSFLNAPSNVSYIGVYAIQANGAATNGDVPYYVDVKYFVEFLSPVTQQLIQT